MLLIQHKGIHPQRLRRPSLLACLSRQLLLKKISFPWCEETMLSKVDGHAYCQADLKLRLTKRALSPFLSLENLILDIQLIHFLHKRSPKFHLPGGNSGVIAAN